MIQKGMGLKRGDVVYLQRVKMPSAEPHAPLDEAAPASVFVQQLEIPPKYIVRWVSPRPKHLRPVLRSAPCAALAMIPGIKFKALYHPRTAANPEASGSGEILQK